MPNNVIYFCELCKNPTGQTVVVIEDSKYREHKLCVACWAKIVKQIEKKRLEKAMSVRFKPS
jgi:hypothetical protein